MPNNLEFMFSKVPFFLQKDRNKKILEPIANSFDDIEDSLDLLDKAWILSLATGENLDNIGTYLNVSRGNSWNVAGEYWEIETDTSYKQRLTAHYATVFNKNTVDNILSLVKLISGEYPLAYISNWQYDELDPDYSVNKATVRCSIDISNVFSILRDLTSAGTITDYEVI